MEDAAIFFFFSFSKIIHVNTTPKNRTYIDNPGAQVIRMISNKKKSYLTRIHIYEVLQYNLTLMTQNSRQSPINVKYERTDREETAKQKKTLCPTDRFTDRFKQHQQPPPRPRGVSKIFLRY